MLLETRNVVLSTTKEEHARNGRGIKQILRNILVQQTGEMVTKFSMRQYFVRLNAKLVNHSFSMLLTFLHLMCQQRHAENDSRELIFISS